jgi:hypothetical protein
MGSAPDAVQRLVDLSACNAQSDHFDQNRKVFLASDDKEEQLRAEFLNPFFTALGWDMDMAAGVLGQVYEQFLGKVIRLTAGHQAKVEEKPEVRKARRTAARALDVVARRGYIGSEHVRQEMKTLCVEVACSSRAWHLRSRR